MIDNMIIAFFGHSKSCGETNLKDKVSSVLEREVKADPVDFYLGGYGIFDYAAQRACVEYKEKNEYARLFFITPYFEDTYLKNRDFITEDCDDVIFPPIENVPKKYAIIERNKWIVKRADLIISLIDRPWGGAANAVEYAKKIKKRIINLGSYPI